MQRRQSRSGQTCNGIPLCLRVVTHKHLECAVFPGTQGLAQSVRHQTVNQRDRKVPENCVRRHCIRKAVVHPSPASGCARLSPTDTSSIGFRAFSLACGFLAKRRHLRNNPVCRHTKPSGTGLQVGESFSTNRLRLFTGLIPENKHQCG